MGRPLGRAWRWLTALYALLTGLDALLLWGLTRGGHSFGPFKSNLIVMHAPRLAVAIFAAILSRFTPLGSIISFIGLQFFGTLSYIWGLWAEPFTLTTSEHTLRSAKIPATAKPVRLLHLSDFHVERLTVREAKLLELIAQLQPDIIVITGDYLNLSYVDDPHAQAEAHHLLSQLHAPYGVYATLGSPPADPRHITPALFNDTSVRLLRDEVAVLDLPEGYKISLIGLDCEHDVAADSAVFQHLQALTPPDSLQILLYHSPELMPHVQQYPVELYLCGHTHGGQVRLPFYGALITSSVTGKRYEMGHYTEQETTLYVSRGIGLEGLSAPRLRLLCPPEVIFWTFINKEQ